MEKARYNTELFPNLSQPLNNVKPSNFWGSHHFCAMFFYKNRRTAHVYSPPPSASLYSFLSLYLSSLLLPSTFTPCFPLSLPQLPSIPTPCFSLSCPCFSLFPPLLPSVLAPNQICFSTPQIHQSPFFFPRLFPAVTHPFRH